MSVFEPFSLIILLIFLAQLNYIKMTTRLRLKTCIIYLSLYKIIKISKYF